MKVIIDRFEGNYAICEKKDFSTIDILKEKLPADAKQGDVLVVDEKFESIVVDKEATKKLKEEIENMQ